MGFSRDYSLERLENAISLNSLEDAEAVEEGYQVEDLFIPDKWFPRNYAGTNISDMEIGCLSNGDWVFTKEFSANYGRAGKAGVMAAILYDRLDVSSPDIGFDGEKLVIEHLGQLEDPRRSESIRPEALEKAVAAKAVAGDPDIGGNIGLDDKNQCYIYDFDQAGGPTGENLERNVVDYIESIDNQNNSLTISREHINQEATSMAQKINLDDYREELESVLDEHFEGSYGFNDLDLRTVYSNIEHIQENDVVTGDVENLQSYFGF